MHVSCYIYYTFYRCYIYWCYLCQTACSIWAAVSTALLTMFETFDQLIVVWVIPLLDLWWLKSFTIILCSLAYWSSAAYVMYSRHFFDWTYFFTSKCLVVWNNNSVLHTSFSASMYWHFSTRFFICWSSLSIDSSSPCLISAVHFIDMVPVGGQNF